MSLFDESDLSEITDYLHFSEKVLPDLNIPHYLC